MAKKILCERCGRVFSGSVNTFQCPSCRKKTILEIRERDAQEEQQRREEARRWIRLRK